MFNRPQPRRKISLDLDADNYALLNQYSAPTTQIINTLVRLFLNLPASLKRNFAKFIAEQLNELQETIHGSPAENKYTIALSHKDIDILRELLDFFTDGKGYKPQEDNMQRIEMQFGYLLCPSDWLIVNPYFAKTSTYAYVLEVNHMEEPSPHCVIFANVPLRDTTEDWIYDDMQRVYPELREIRSKVVQPIYSNGKWLNIEEWRKAPLPGLFQIPFWGERERYKDYPCGAMIVMTEKKGGEATLDL